MEKELVQTTIRIPKGLLKRYKNWLLSKDYSINRHVKEMIELVLALEEGKLTPQEIREKLFNELVLELFFSELGQNPFYRRGVSDERKRIVRHLLGKKEYKNKKVEDIIEDISNLLGISKALAEKIVREVRKTLQETENKGP